MSEPRHLPSELPEPRSKRVLTWVAFAACVAVYVGFTTLKMTVDGTSAWSALLVALAFVGIIAVVVAVDVRRDRRKRSAETLPIRPE